MIQAGIDPDRDDVRIGPVPGGDAPGASFGVSAAKALEAGAIDGFWANAMGAETAIRAGVGSIVLDLRRGDEPQATRSYTFSALVSSEKLIKDNPEAVSAAMRAVSRAQRELRKEPDLAAEVGKRLFPKQQASMIADVVRRDLPFYEPSISPADVDGLNAFTHAVGLLSAPVPYEQVVAVDFRHLWTA